MGSHDGIIFAFCHFFFTESKIYDAINHFAKFHLANGNI